MKFNGKNRISRLLLSGAGFCLLLMVACTGSHLELGQLPEGENVSFVRTEGTGWGLEIKGGNIPELVQPKPARLEIFQAEDSIQKLEFGYDKIQKKASEVNAFADIRYDENVVFHILDRWKLEGEVISVNRKIEIEGSAEGGFNSSVEFTVEPSVNWSDIKCLAPGGLYGDPTYDGERAPGGTMNYQAKRFVMREDILPAPLFAVSFANGSSVSVLDPAPRCESTMEETKLVKDVMSDARFQFGALGVWQNDQEPIELGFIFPGTTNLFRGGRDAPAVTRWIRRYHPIEAGTTHEYEVNFRIGKNETFPGVIRDSWRWAWNTVKPTSSFINVEQMRRLLIDQLASQVATIDGRTGIPFVMSTIDTTVRQWNWTMIALGFVGKNLEGADQLLREGDRDTSERGQKMRQSGLNTISSMIQALNKMPLQATGYDLATGKPWDHEWLAPWLRNASEDMRTLMLAYKRELKNGHEHPEWLKWVKSYTDWLILQQRDDGSFPRRWERGTSVAAETTGTTSYAPVPLYVLMSEITGDPKYLQAATRAADFVWENSGKQGFFIGGASDNPNITDKEAGMLSLEAFLSLYEATNDSKWLEYAKTAADFAESWIWIWNLPMPLDADDNELHWKTGVPTMGLQGITAMNTGSVDEYMSWSVPAYAKLYKYTGDEHYLDVARVLLHDTKSMVAIPGKLRGLRGPGWQQEHWRMGPAGSGRGIGSHRFWLPWVTTNHLRGITGLEEFDQDIYNKLTMAN